MTLRLRPPAVADEEQAEQAHRELAADSFEFLLDRVPGESWAQHAHRQRQLHRGLDVPPGRVPATFLLACDGADVVGRVSIRHALNDSLLTCGGHIGFGVRPGSRRHGWATAILRQALVVARAEGVDRVLLTGDDDNTASAATITRRGGVLEDVVAGPHGRLTRRYWVD